MRVAVDIGGTFTDVVVLDPDGTWRATKVLTTPDDHTRGIAHGLEALGIDLRAVERLAHGSTIAINTVIEQKGARAGLITTAGFRDVYEIGRSNRPDAYNLHFRRPEPLIPRERRVEVRERVNARGEVLVPLDATSLAAAIAALEAQGVEAVAVCLLHAYANPAHEQAIGEALRARHPEWYLSLSSAIVREVREYERTSTTALNAYVGPVVSRYLASLEALLAERGFRGQLLIMQSNGGVMSVEAARVRPVAMMESGPVAGVMGAAAVGQALDQPNVISFDMGGTTAKASLVRGGELEIATTYYVGGYATGQPLLLPVVDIVEVGAGGGSIAWLDGAGALKVGPRSAGAVPGPACFGLGGEAPTVTDANVVLGRIDADQFLGGALRIDCERAEHAVRRVAEPLGLSVREAAAGIVTIADANMALAVRAVSVERGRDPREFALVVSGGGGPLHGASIARALGIPWLIVPQRASVFSAEGLLTAPLRHDLVQTFLADLAQMDLAELAARLAPLMAEARRALAADGAPPEAIVCQPLLDLRYVGQEHTLSVPVDAAFAHAGLAALHARFDALHAERYGHSAPHEPLQVVNLRVRATAPESRAPAAVGAPAGSRDPTGRARDAEVARRGTQAIVFDAADGPLPSGVYERARLPVGARVAGPALIQEYGTATLLWPGDWAEVTPPGHLRVRVAPRGRAT
ncbi:MAG TPA: hydantoinase/oxoprolinase family protein [Chloroflexota bacterium]|nr:hydantoinase/oxoprolinase family protein [Chloroflexota bacterium]